MKLLVTIASYGNNNDRYLERVLSEYRSLPYDTDIVVLSNIHKELGSNIEVITGLPARNPRSLPFGHKPVFAKRRNDYDLFIYSEDDMLVTRRNIEAFLRVTTLLPPDQLAGFFQWESYPDGRLFFPAVHNWWRWRPDSVQSVGEYTYAQYTNYHSACYVLTREQLNRAISSGGFLVGPHDSRYQLRETAATDPYTQCGFMKILCISHLDDFLVAHLPNKYAGTRLGLDASYFLKQIEALSAFSRNGGPPQSLLEPEAKTFQCEWSKDYYEPCRQDLLAMFPPSVRNVLSIGCGWGATESALVKKGIHVVGIPLDPIIAKCAESEGIELAYGDFETAAAQLADRRFDAVLMPGVLHLMPEPPAVLRTATSLLADNGVLVMSLPNVGRFPDRWRRARHPSRYRGLGNYSQCGMHCIDRTQAINLLRNSGLEVERTAETRVPDKWKSVPALAKRLFSLEFVIAGRKSASSYETSGGEFDHRISGNSRVQSPELSAASYR